MSYYPIYNSALTFTECCKEQKRAFTEYLITKSKDPVDDALVFDFESTGVNFNLPQQRYMPELGGAVKVHDIQPFGIALAFPVEEHLALAWCRDGTEMWDDAMTLLATDKPKVAHNLRYDLRLARAYGVELNGELCDTLTMARIHWNRRTKFDLKDLGGVVCPELYGWDDELKGMLRNLKSSHTRAGYPKNYVNYSFLDDEVIGEYAMIDGFQTWVLNFVLRPYIDREHAEVYRREMQVLRIVLDMEERGMCFSCVQAKREAEQINEKMRGLERTLKNIADCDFSPGSPKQLLPVLLDIGVPKELLIDKKTKKLTTNKDQLVLAEHKLENTRLKKFVETLLNWRSCKKLVGTYLEPLRERARYNNGIVYGSINPADTRTGRMASKNPNLHNIPRPTSGFDEHNPVRNCFICRKGYFNVFADYSQMEMWLFAIHSGGDSLLKGLMNGMDAHEQTSIDMLGDEALDEDGKVIKTVRQKFKAVNFGIIYGMGFKALALKIKTSEMEAYDLRHQYLEQYPEVTDFVDKCASDLRQYGYVEDIFGKKYNLEVRDAYKAVNAIVQGSCAQILKIALIKLDKYIKASATYGLNKRIRLLAPIHDELISEMPKCMPLTEQIRFLKTQRNCMEKIPQLMDKGIRLSVDFKYSDTSWENKRELDICKGVRFGLRTKKAKCVKQAG
jgi:DNA polymerase-1